MPLDDAMLQMLPDTLTVEVDGKATPLREHAFVKEAKDFPTFVKTAFDAHREVGSRIPLRVDKTKPETIEAWRKEHLPKLYEAGILNRPVGSPAEYGIKRPEQIPAGLGWDDKRAEEYATLAHKHGLTKEAVEELMAFHLGSLQNIQSMIKTSYDDGMKALKEEFKDNFAQREEQASRLAAALFKNEAELAWFEEVGLANHPTFLSVLMRLAPLVEQDSSVLRGLPGMNAGGLTGDDVKRELADIMSNPENPKYKLYWAGDKDTLAYIDTQYKKVYGDAQVQLSGGLAAGGDRR